ncbi:MAG: P-loop NTPase, partial [Verrucomicrobiota bacterium]|nr:P-loop NTPase [Verrucomicrobiota bacterium]
MMENLCEIDHKLLVMSGKGGVGKSTVAANLATSLADAGYKTGLMDVDIHGPSIPTLFNLSGQRLMQNKKGIIPIDVSENLKVMSVGFFLENEDQPLIWRGPMKMGLIQQFLRDVSWGELDYLIIDSPPGTGDEPLSVCQLIE